MQEWPDDEHEPQAEGLDVPPEPDHENVLMSFLVRFDPQLGQGMALSLDPRTISSKRSWHFSHWYSNMGMVG